ncbi:MAG: AAA family ATPase [Candidatus Zixiibacteriota bacterium]|nr:MAG: AAA family ATPase [candidate division Zixibacteria bacterium]
MKYHKPNILVTGFPGVGKTTLIQRVIENLCSHRPVGFYTEEIREGGSRVGFGLTTLDGRRQILSHVTIKGSHRVGRYGVDVAGFEKLLDTMDLTKASNRPVIVDEIGKMECLSGKFQRWLQKHLDAQTLLIATIAMKGGGLIESVKRRHDVELLTLTRQNQDALLEKIVARAEAALS